MDNLDNSAEEIRNKIGDEMELNTAITLGSGLGSFTDKIDVLERIDYEEITGMRSSTVEGHKGEFVIGSVNGVNLIAMNGRIHYYEVGNMKPVVQPIRILSRLGINQLVLTNASGGVNENYSPGDLMIIEDHINQMGDNPLIGEHKESYGSRFPDMTDAYDTDLREVAKNLSQETYLDVHEGVYVANSGPTYETPAEIRKIREFGGDAVGMSTVPECIVANQEGMSVLGISTITNHAAGVTGEPLSHEEVKETASRIEKPMNNYISSLIERI